MKRRTGATDLTKGNGRQVPPTWTSLAATAVLMLLGIFSLQEARSSFSVAITADKDSAVDTLVNFPYQGDNHNTWVNYDPSFGPSISRTYIRFPLSVIDPIAHVIGARIDLNCNFVLAGGGTVEVYRSANDDWPEFGINFGNQPGWTGTSLAVGGITSAGPKSINLSLANWNQLADINDGYVTFVLKTLESPTVGTIRFDSIQMPGGTPPRLVITVRNAGNIDNPDMDEGLDGWNTAGTVTTAAHPDDPTNTVALLQTASQAAMWQAIDTPDGFFAVELEADFLGETGTFNVLIDNQVVFSATAPRGIPGGFDVTDEALYGLNDVDLKFTLDGPDGVTSQLYVDELRIIAIPEPPLSIAPGATPGTAVLSFYAEPNGWYDLETSIDFADWQPHGHRVSGRLDMLYEELVPTTESRRFFRLRTLSWSEPEDLPIPNNGFEDPVLGDNGNTTSVPHWATSGGAGVWNPPASIYPEDIMEGGNVAYVHDGHQLSQQLTHVLEPYRIYNLDTIVGRRADIGFPPGADLILQAGGVTLTPFEVASPALSAGQLEPWWRRYKIGGDHPQLGEPLTVILSGGPTTVPTTQVNFDTVILEVE